LGQLKRAQPRIQVVVIAGNHDSAARLEAPRELLAAFDVRVVGSIERAADGRIDSAGLLVPLRDRGGQVTALCVAIPFLRAADVLALAPPVPAAPLARPAPGGLAIPTPANAIDDAAAGADPLIAGMRALHEELFRAARAKRLPGQALVAMAHGYLVGGALSALSERKVLGGNQHALPLDLFPDDCAYVALGHLHRPQRLGEREHVRYSGSPLPLSMPERLHAHHVLFVDLEGERVQKVWSLRVPRKVALLRIPEHGALDPEAALAAVAALPPRAAGSEDLRPLVEVAVQATQPSPQLGERVARAIADREARLVRVEVVLAGAQGDGDGDGPRPVELCSLSPEEVFVRRYHKDHAGPVPEPLLALFRELLEAVEHGGPA
jgi:exonuclease SbcD